MSQTCVPNGHPIDFCRGVHFKHSFALGFAVYTYTDQPGEYFDNRGNPLPEAIAKRAGWDVERQRALKGASDAVKAVKAEMAEALGSGPATGPLVLAEGKTYRLLAAGEGLAIIATQDGHHITKAQSESVARAIFDEIEGAA